jgi:hypothetical protein
MLVLSGVFNTRILDTIITRTRLCACQLYAYSYLLYAKEFKAKLEITVNDSKVVLSFRAH